MLLLLPLSLLKSVIKIEVTIEKNKYNCYVEKMVENLKIKDNLSGNRL